MLATDGAWNVVTPDMAVQCVSESEKSNEKHMIDPQVIIPQGDSQSVSFNQGGHRAGDRQGHWSSVVFQPPKANRPRQVHTSSLIEYFLENVVIMARTVLSINTT